MIQGRTVFLCSEYYFQTKYETLSVLTGVPNCMQFSRVRTKSGLVSLMTCRLFAFSMFLIHLFACPCGSIINGQRRAFLWTGKYTYESHVTSLSCWVAKKSVPRNMCHLSKLYNNRAGAHNGNMMTVSVCEPTYARRTTNRSQLPLVTCDPSFSASIKYFIQLDSSFISYVYIHNNWNSLTSGTYDNIIPLSMENESVGKPAMFQARIFTWSPRVAISEKSSEQGIPRSFTLFIHTSIWSCKQTEILLSFHFNNTVRTGARSRLKSSSVTYSLETECSDTIHKLLLCQWEEYKPNQNPNQCWVEAWQA